MAGDKNEIPGAISSGPFEIDRASLSPSPTSRSGPPIAVISNALERGRPQPPLARLIAISAGVVFLLVAASLLLFC